MYRIVAVDNFGRDNISDQLIFAGIEDEEDAQTVCDIFNKVGGLHSPKYYKVYKPGKELYVFEP